MMMKMTTTTSSALSKPPSTICGGYIDLNGVWNNGLFFSINKNELIFVILFFSIGFACPVQNLVQYYCCGNDDEHYCCPPDRYLSELSNSDEILYISGQYQPTNHIVIDHNNRSLLIDHSKLINKQFEQFQKIFLPIFLLTSSILFLIGIAIWFWLYKHKAFYATERDDFNDEQTFVRRRSSPSLPNKQNSTHLIAERQSRRISSHPSTEV